MAYHVLGVVQGAAVVGLDVDVRAVGRVGLGGVGVHDEDLWGGAVLFDPEGQRIFYFRRDVRHALAGVIFDAARAAGDILPAAALRVVLFEDSARVLRPGVLAQKLHKVALDASRRSGGFGL